MPALRERSVPANGIRFHVAEQGDGPLVLLLHGFPERFYSFRHQMAPLAEAGYRAVAPDLRGYGESDRPDPSRGGYDLETLAADVAALIASLGEKDAIVVGHDWGGVVMWEALSRHPSSISRFVSINSVHPAVFLRTLLRSPEQRRRSVYTYYFQLPYLPERALSRDDGGALERVLLRHGLDAETAARLRDDALRPGALTAMLAYYRSLGRSLLHPLRAMRRFASYGPIAQPGLILFGARDEALGVELCEPHRAYARDLRIQLVEDAGHFVHEERPDVTNRALLDFLGRARA